VQLFENFVKDGGNIIYQNVIDEEINVLLNINMT